MLHYHNRYMRGTRLDVVVGLASVLFVLLLIVVLVNPIRALAEQRDAIRTEHVRELMTKVLQLELIDPLAYASLLAEVRNQGDLRVVIGLGDCSGSHGPSCSDAITGDVCIAPSQYFPSLLLSTVPIDPQTKMYNATRTGYYLLANDGQLEIGACGASLAPISLRK